MTFPYTFPFQLGPAQVLYPNIIYDPVSGTEVFIDYLSKIEPSGGADVIPYRSALDGQMKTFARDVEARSIGLGGKILQANGVLMRRVLTYLRGKQVYLMLGASDFATRGRIINFDIAIKPGTHLDIAIDFICDSDTEGQFYEAEDTRLTRNSTTSYVSDTAASMAMAYIMDTQQDHFYLTLTQSDVVLPVGNYVMLVRAKDANQVTADLEMYVRNSTDDSYPMSATHKTVTADYRWYSQAFVIDSDDVGNSIVLRCAKDTTTANTVTVDCFAFVKV